MRLIQQKLTWWHHMYQSKPAFGQEKLGHSIWRLQVLLHSLDQQENLAKTGTEKWQLLTTYTPKMLIQEIKTLITCNDIDVMCSLFTLTI